MECVFVYALILQPLKVMIYYLRIVLRVFPEALECTFLSGPCLEIKNCSLLIISKLGPE